MKAYPTPDKYYPNDGPHRSSLDVTTNPNNYPKTFEHKPKNNAYIDKETATDLESIIDDRIKFVEANMHRNPEFLKPELQRLMEIFKTVQLISCGMEDK